MYEDKCSKDQELACSLMPVTDRTIACLVLLAFFGTGFSIQDPYQSSLCLVDLVKCPLMDQNYIHG